MQISADGCDLSRVGIKSRLGELFSVQDFMKQCNYLAAILAQVMDFQHGGRVGTYQIAY